MQVRKTDIRSCILDAARDSFSRKSYLRTSIREIADSAGVSVGNIYTYFSGKDALLKAVVAPVLDHFETMLMKHHGSHGTDAVDMFTEEYLHEVAEDYLHMMDRYRLLLKILLFRSQGSSLENFREEYTDRATALVREWFRENKLRHPEINVDVSDFSIHLHTVWMFSMMEEVIMHDVSLPQMEQIIKEYVCFEIQGWKYIMAI